MIKAPTIKAKTKPVVQAAPKLASKAAKPKPMPVAQPPVVAPPPKTPPVKNRLVLCVDFDGVLHQYDSGWQGAEVVNDAPVPGALAWLWACHEAGFDVQIYSSRSKSKGGVDAMLGWIEGHAHLTLGDDHPLARDAESCLSFPTQKPAAFLTIDDRCIRFDGSFASLAPDMLKAFKPWNKP